MRSAFVGALATGDASALARVLAEDAVFVSDGGGVVKAALKPVRGRDHVTRLLFGLQAKVRGAGDVVATPAIVNGLHGLVLDVRVPEGADTAALGGTLQVLALDVTPDGLVRALYLVSNPDKLAHVARVRAEEGW